MSGASYDSFTVADEVTQCVSVSKTITVRTFLLCEHIQSSPHNFRDQTQFKEPGSGCPGEGLDQGFSWES